MTCAVTARRGCASAHPLGRGPGRGVLLCSARGAALRGASRAGQQRQEREGASTRAKSKAWVPAGGSSRAGGSKLGRLGEIRLHVVAPPCPDWRCRFCERDSILRDLCVMSGYHWGDRRPLLRRRRAGVPDNDHNRTVVIVSRETWRQGSAIPIANPLWIRKPSAGAQQASRAGTVGHARCPRLPQTLFIFAVVVTGIQRP